MTNLKILSQFLNKEYSNHKQPPARLLPKVAPKLVEAHKMPIPVVPLLLPQKPIITVVQKAHILPKPDTSAPPTMNYLAGNYIANQFLNMNALNTLNQYCQNQLSLLTTINNQRQHHHNNQKNENTHVNFTANNDHNMDNYLAITDNDDNSSENYVDEFERKFGTSSSSHHCRDSQPECDNESNSLTCSSNYNENSKTKGSLLFILINLMC